MECSAFVVWATMLARVDPEVSSLQAAVIKEEVKQRHRVARDSAAAFLVAESLDSKKGQTALHTFPISFAHESASTAEYASITLPRTWTQAGDNVESTFDGDDDKITARVSGSWALT